MASNIIWITIFLENKLRTQVRFDTVGEKNGVVRSCREFQRQRVDTRGCCSDKRSYLGSSFLFLSVIRKDCVGICWRIMSVIGKDEILEAGVLVKLIY